MSKIGEPKVRFLSLCSLQTSRGGFLLAERALFTLLSLLFVADSGTRQRAIAFFLSLYAFCHLADLRFRSFSQLLASSASSPAQTEPVDPLSGNILALLLDASTVGTRAEDLSPSAGGFRQRFSSKRSTTARELRRGARGRCPRRGEEEEALRIDTDVFKQRA
jgi:hypothetical protein